MDFPYHRSLAPMMWVFFALASIEMAVVHLLVSLWKPWIAAILSLASLSGIVWIALAIRSFRRLPVRLEGDWLILRAGTLKSIKVPLNNIAGLRHGWDGAELKRRSVLNLALIAYPNVIIDLKAPVLVGRGRFARDVTAVAHKFDDQAVFSAEIARHIAGQA